MCVWVEGVADLKKVNKWGLGVQILAKYTQKYLYAKNSCFFLIKNQVKYINLNNIKTHRNVLCNGTCYIMSNIYKGQIMIYNPSKDLLGFW